MKGITGSSTGVLSDLVMTQAFNKLAITPYLKTQPCSLLDAIFTGHQDGWTKGNHVTLNTLSYCRHSYSVDSHK